MLGANGLHNPQGRLALGRPLLGNSDLALVAAPVEVTVNVGTDAVNAFGYATPTSGSPSSFGSATPEPVFAQGVRFFGLVSELGTFTIVASEDLSQSLDNLTSIEVDTGAVPIVLDLTAPDAIGWTNVGPGEWIAAWTAAPWDGADVGQDRLVTFS